MMTSPTFIFALWIATDMVYGGLLFPHGPSAGDTLFRRCDDCFEAVPVSVPYRFFGQAYDTIYVGSNGYVTFGAGSTKYKPDYFDVSDGTKMVAPLWSDVYLLINQRSHIWYREATDKKMLKKTLRKMKKHFGDCGNRFVPTSVFIVTWQNVASYCEGTCPWNYFSFNECHDYFHSHIGMGGSFDYNGTDIKRLGYPSESELQRFAGREWYRKNYFQVVLATDGYDTFAIFNMEKVDWDECYEINMMVFSAGDGVGFYVNHIGFPLAVFTKESNINQPGRWAFKISESKIQIPNCTYVHSDV